MLNCLNVKIRHRAFTLVELLVATAVFAIVIGIISGIFISGIQQQRRVLISQFLLDQTSFVLEYMSRALRMAAKDLTGSCIPAGSNYQLTYGGSGLKFKNHLRNDDCQEFFLQDGQLKYWKQSTGETLPLTPNKLEITQLKFNLSGESQNDNLQPAVTIFLNIKGKDITMGELTLKIQTTVSQRAIDISY